MELRVAAWVQALAVFQDECGFVPKAWTQKVTVTLSWRCLDASGLLEAKHFIINFLVIFSAWPIFDGDAHYMTFIFPNA